LYSFILLLRCSFEQFNKPNQMNADVQRETIEALLTSPRYATERCLRPEFIRLAPPLHLAEDEVRACLLIRNFHQLRPLVSHSSSREGGGPGFQIS
jgi:hypothetical protein